MNSSAVTGGPAAELAAGAAVSPGLILGAGVWASMLSWPVYARRDSSEALDLTKSLDFAVAGLVADHYLTGRDGLHAQLGFGLAEVGGYARLRNPAGDGAAGIGGGLMFGLGYEAWVQPDWGIGALARLTTAVTREFEGNTWLHTTAPALLVTATYN
jgi:hypothetical protein